MVLVGDQVTAAALADLEDIEYTPYTVSTSGVTLGSGGYVSGRYKEVGRFVHAIVYFSFGSGGTIGATPYFSAPFTPAGDQRFVGHAVYTIGSRYFGRLMQSGSNILLLRDTESASAITSTTPATWGSGSLIEGAFTFERS